ncbi:MAG: hypothetical protein ACR2RV_12685 [Verrucomicrobiales bacterium]
MPVLANPFLNDVHVAGLAELAAGAAHTDPTVESINAEALGRLGGYLDQFDGESGGVVLLSSARAGFGKSHLLARLVEAHSGESLFVPVEINRDSRPDWLGMLHGVLGACTQVRSQDPQVSFLEEMSRSLMAEAAVELILRGEVPAADPAGAISMLKRDYLAAFDMRGGGSEVVRWMADNFNALLPLMGAVLGERAAVETDEAVAWLRVLARYNRGDAAERKAVVASVAMLGGDDSPGQSGAKQRLRSFCRLASIVRPLVLVFDHVDSLSSGKRDAFQLACMLAEMGRLQFGVGAVLSVNGDVWTSSFDGRLPSALEDRLTGREVELGGLNWEQAEELLRLRLVGSEASAAEIERFFRGADLEALMQGRCGVVLGARDILRHAATVWDRLIVGGSEDAGEGTEPTSPSGESVRDYLPGDMPHAESLAEPLTLQPIRELVGNGGPQVPSTEPGKVDPGMIKQMGNITSLLRELKSRREQFVPAAGEREGYRGAPIVPSAEDVDDFSDSSVLVQRFGEIREALLSKRAQGLDLEALRRMVSLAGERFPVVESSEFKMSPGDEPTVMKWVFPGNEIMFGFEPEHQFRFWQSLIKLAGRRMETTVAGRLKLVVFSESDRPFSGAASLEEEEMQEARRNFLDVIDLDPGMIASIIAADRVVCEMAKADEPVLPADAIRELAPQLDPLWRRITRPLRGEITD